MMSQRTKDKIAEYAKYSVLGEVLDYITNLQEEGSLSGWDAVECIECFVKTLMSKYE